MTVLRHRHPAARLGYVMPIKRPPGDDDRELASYLWWLSERAEVVVADGSPPDVFAAHHALWGDAVRHVPVTSTCLNGKVAGVVDGVLATTAEAVVVADDDVRYDDSSLDAMRRLLQDHVVVRPQNFFAPLPWHARWDSARSLLNRALGHDYPGTIGVRRSAFVAAGGYCGGVLFENLELYRTMAAHGHRVHDAPDLLVRRLPPATGQFAQQRVRQAFDSFAEPGRMALELAVAPAVLSWALLGRPGRGIAAGAATALTVGVAELGRRRGAARRVFPWTSSWWAPLWVLERGVCSWLAVAARLRGGVAYRDRRLATAAHTVTEISTSTCRSRGCGCRTPLSSRSTGDLRREPA